MKAFLDSWSKFTTTPITERVDPNKVDTSSFKINDILEENIWSQNKKLKPRIRERLMHIASKFWESIELPTVKIDDITFTGSLANYNWSVYSDVDLHILVDFNLLPGDEEITKAMMNARRAMWNNKHNIEIHGYEVELYVQDSNEVHHSTGVYSVLKNEWEVEPERGDFTIDHNDVKVKAAHIMNQIDIIERDYEEENYRETVSDVDRLKQKLRKFRKCGLQQGGEYSTENIAFKVLRRNGYLEKLSKLKTDSYDKIMSL
tara:strand:+ start:463 stop:1242 length:780 start_codon:yes stop_codon:yes gene_type:complete